MEIEEWRLPADPALPAAPPTWGTIAISGSILALLVLASLTSFGLTKLVSAFHTHEAHAIPPRVMPPEPEVISLALAETDMETARPQEHPSLAPSLPDLPAARPTPPSLDPDSTRHHRKADDM